MSNTNSTINLVPSPEKVKAVLTKTGAYRHGHFLYPNGKHTSHYFQMPLAFRYYDTARVLSVGLSRLFRMSKGISVKLPKISVISPSPGGIPIAFGIREALEASQIYWAEIEQDGTRQFRQYLGQGEVYPAIIVDDIIRTGTAIKETINLVKELGSEVIGIGSIVHFEDAPRDFDGIEVQSLYQVDCNFYDSEDEWKAKTTADVNLPAEKVRH